MKTLVLCAVLLILNIVLWTQFPPLLHKPSNLDPPPGPYTWTRVNPEPNLTCLIFEAQYNTHPIAAYCERIEP